MKSPCRDCEFLGEDKNNDSCIKCEKRIEYVAYIGGQSGENTVLQPEKKKPGRPKAEVKIEARREPKPITEKECMSCKKSKPLGEFSINRAYSDGHQTWCKACMSAIRKNTRNRKEAELINQLFSGFESIKDEVETMARRDFRTSRQQVLFLVAVAIDTINKRKALPK